MSFASVCIHSDHRARGLGGSETQYRDDLSSFSVWGQTDPYVIAEESDGMASKMDKQINQVPQYPDCYIDHHG